MTALLSDGCSSVNCGCLIKNYLYILLRSIKPPILNGTCSLVKIPQDYMLNNTYFFKYFIFEKIHEQCSICKAGAVLRENYCTWACEYFSANEHEQQLLL